MSEAPRSMEATSPREVARVTSMRSARPNGWWGVLLLIATEASLFGTLLASYFYLRFQTAPWPPDGIAPPSTVVPLVLTGVLVTTSLPMQLAAGAARRGRLGLVRLALFAALVVQSGYFAMQMHLFLSDLDKFTPREDAYGSIYFTLLGADHAHVFVGLLLDVWLLARLAGGLTNYRATGVVAVAFYWHFVNLLTLLVVGAILSPAA